MELGVKTSRFKFYHFLAMDLGDFAISLIKLISADIEEPQLNEQY